MRDLAASIEKSIAEPLVDLDLIFARTKLNGPGGLGGWFGRSVYTRADAVIALLAIYVFLKFGAA